MCGEIHLGTPGRNFLFTKPFCGENVLLHSKSNWNVSTIILVRIQIVSKEEYFKLFSFGETFKLRQYIITFTVQNFLLNRKNSANKEVCNSFFLSTTEWHKMLKRSSDAARKSQFWTKILTPTYAVLSQNQNQVGRTSSWRNQKFNLAFLPHMT